MRTIRFVHLAVAAFMLVGCAGPKTVDTKKIPKEFVEFGGTRVDNYYWLSKHDDPEVIAHLQAENTYTDEMLKGSEEIQKTIFDELIARIEQRYESLPHKVNGYWYYIRYEEGKQYPLYCRKKETMAAREEVFLDVPELAAGHQIYLVRGYSVSPTNEWVAYGVDTSGGRRCDLFLLNLYSEERSPEVITNTSGGYVWANDGKTLFYVLNDHTVRAYKVMRHALGTDPSIDEPVFVESDSTFEISLSASRDNKYLFLTSGDTEPRESYYMMADAPRIPPILVQRRQKNLVYSMNDYEGDTFYILTNQAAQNFRLVRAPIRNPGIVNWKDLIPHRSDALLVDADVFKNYIVADQRIDGLPRILVFDRTTGGSHYVDLKEESYVANAYPATDAFDLDSIRYSYSSLTTPRSDFLYDLRTGKKTLLKQEKIGGGYDGTLYSTRRVWATAGDSVRVPISVVYRTSLFKRDGSNPALLYAYGSYGANTDPYFNASVISLLDRGFLFAIAHIRGGQEMGRQWYEEGKLLKKKNTFSDYISCAQFLVDEKYTSASRLFANGGSAGGMLMGAVINMRPDLFRGVLAEVPWMDVVTDMFNPDLPLTTLEYGEWGNPHIRDQYEYMLSWSPYDNVRPAVYPAILATGGLNDTQVPYYSPAKWVAKVREFNRGTEPVLFKCNMGAGHGGESGRFERQRLTALKYAFIVSVLNGKLP